ncbi:hypothetical protein GN956_G24157 [Arapaima gigas]
MACGIYTKLLWCFLLIWSHLPEGEQASQRSSLNAGALQRRWAPFQRKGPLGHLGSSEDSGPSEHRNVPADASSSHQTNASSEAHLIPGSPAVDASWGSYLPGFNNNPAYAMPYQNQAPVVRPFPEQAVVSMGGQSPSQHVGSQFGSGPVLDMVSAGNYRKSQAAPVQGVTWVLALPMGYGHLLVSHMVRKQFLQVSIPLGAATVLGHPWAPKVVLFLVGL